MIEDLMKLKNQIEIMIETYKELHPDEDDDVIVRKINEDYEKQRGLNRIREGYYESTFRKKQGKKASKPSEGSPSLCVYGDT